MCFRGAEARLALITDSETTRSLAPPRGASTTRVKLPIDPALISALEASSAEWVLALMDAHRVVFWSAGAAPSDDDPVRAWSRRSRRRASNHARRIRDAMRAVLDPDSVMMAG